jgi:hypothetical protein
MLAAVLSSSGCTAMELISEGDLLDHTNAKLASLSLKPASDGRTEFRDRFCSKLDQDGAKLGFTEDCETYLPDGRLATAYSAAAAAKSHDIRLVFVTGLFGQCVGDDTSMLSGARSFIEENGLAGVRTLRMEVVNVSGYSSSGVNAALLKTTLDDMDLAASERVIVVGHSKGVADTTELLGLYPKTARKVDAVLSVAGAVLGSPLTDNKGVLEWLFQSIKTDCRGPDGAGLNSLKPAVRQEFLKRHPLPARIKYYSLVGNGNRSETSPVLRPAWDLSSTYSSNNDSQVLSTDAVLPGSKLLGFLKADHWAVAMPFDKTHPILAKTVLSKNAYPREIMLSAALEMIVSDID